MEWWADLMTEVLWRNALAVIPLALAAAAIGRWGRCRPSTRHALWLAVLLVFIAPPILLLIHSSPPLARPHLPDSAIDLNTAVGLVEKPSAPSEPRQSGRAQPDLVVPDLPAMRLAQGGAPWQPAQREEPPAFDSGPVQSPTTRARAEPVVPPDPRSSTPPAAARLRGWGRRLSDLRDSMGRLPAPPLEMWLVGVAAWGLVAGARTIRFLRCFRRTRPATRAVRRAVAGAARIVGLRRPPKTVMTDLCISPMIWCGRRARLILPAALWNELDEPGRNAVILHELAHLRRRDHWVRWFEIIVSSLYWWHPLLWWVRRRLNEEADACCDAWVTWLQPRGRRAYAEALLATQRYINGSPAPMPAVGIGVTSVHAKRFSRRLAMVMTQTMKPRLSLSGLTLAVALAIGGWLATPARSDPPRPDAATAHSSTGHNAGPERSSERPPPEVEERLRRLEHQNAELNERLEKIVRMLEGFRQTGGRIPPIVLRPHRDPFAAQTPPDQRLMPRTYELPPRKLELLTALMVLPDVPIQVRPLPEWGIEVHATAQQHEVFQAFLQMIHPHDGIAPVAPTHDGLRPSQTQAQLRHALRQMQEVESQMHAEQERAERAAGRPETVGPDEIDEVRHRLEALTREIDRLREASDQAATEQDRLEGQASELMERAEDLNDRAEKADSRDEANELRSQGRALELQARQIQRQAERTGRDAEKLERRADRLEEESERLQEELDRQR
ncbi:MAG: M56 family metallopeptidase [Phycisphaerae bacterium]